MGGGIKTERKMGAGVSEKERGGLEAGGNTGRPTHLSRVKRPSRYSPHRAQALTSVSCI